MNENNFEYLRDQVKYTGFGESHEETLKEQLQQQPDSFQLKHSQEFGKDKVEATLQFKQSDHTEHRDMYFLNSYDLKLQQDGEKDALRQTFYIGKENNYTLKEAYNMMSGRAVNKDLVNKEGEKYNAWVQMDFKETEQNGNYKLKIFHENYGYNLDEALSKHPIKELANTDDKEKLTESLKKGNRQAATFHIDGKEERRFVEAVPQFKSINVYDGKMQRIRQEQGERQSKGQTQSSKQEQAPGKKAAKSGDEDEAGAIGQPQEQKRKRKTQKL